MKQLKLTADSRGSVTLILILVIFTMLIFVSMYVIWDTSIESKIVAQVKQSGQDVSDCESANNYIWYEMENLIKDLPLKCGTYTTRPSDGVTLASLVNTSLTVRLKTVIIKCQHDSDNPDSSALHSMTNKYIITSETETGKKVEIGVREIYENPFFTMNQ